jgi:hypothetical protein
MKENNSQASSSSFSINDSNDSSLQSSDSNSNIRSFRLEKLDNSIQSNVNSGKNVKIQNKNSLRTKPNKKFHFRFEPNKKSLVKIEDTSSEFNNSGVASNYVDTSLKNIENESICFKASHSNIKVEKKNSINK